MRAVVNAVTTETMAATTQDILQNAPRVIFTGDNLPVLRGMNSACVDLIYLDPPFNSGKQWANPVEAAGRRAMAEFKDTWETSDIHYDERYALQMEYPHAVAIIDALAGVNGESWNAYLIYMGVRLAEMRRILKPRGSIYYHCDPVMSHGVKLLMDAIFGGNDSRGKGNFQNEVIWHYGGGGATTKRWGKKHDTLLFYSRGDRFVFNADAVRRPHKWDRGQRRADGSARNYAKGALADDVISLHGVMPWSKERSGYPTQKPLALLEQIIKASSNPGDIVLDPFCGCATTCLAAQRLERHWIGIDLSQQTADLIVSRLRAESSDNLVSVADDIKHLTKAPQRTDLPKRASDAVIRTRLYRQQHGECAGCDEQVELKFMDLDHIVARARGGQDVDDNLQLLCRECNTKKGSRGMQWLHRQILQKRAYRQMHIWRREQEAKRRAQTESAYL